MKIFPIFLFCTIVSLAQEQRDSAELISKAYFLNEVKKDLFSNGSHSTNCFFVIKNGVLEPDPSKRFVPSQYRFENFIILLYPRKYLIGHNINYWIQIDELSIDGSKAFMRFRTVCSDDNWFEENDVAQAIIELNFARSKDGSWEIFRKKVKLQKK